MPQEWLSEAWSEEGILVDRECVLLPPEGATRPLLHVPPDRIASPEALVADHALSHLFRPHALLEPIQGRKVHPLLLLNGWVFLPLPLEFYHLYLEAFLWLVRFLIRVQCGSPFLSGLLRSGTIEEDFYLHR